MLCMMLAVCQAYAQEESTVNVVDQDQETEPAQPTSKNFDVNELLELLQQMKEPKIDEPIYFPIVGKKKFSRRNHIFQTLELSTIMGKDRDPDDVGDTRGNGKAPGFAADMNIGLNVGYSLTIAPGKIEGDQLRLNRFGFGYKFGLVAAFDRQDDHDVTCDFLLKLGTEVGIGRPLGIGLDFLFGGGKNARTNYFFDTKALGTTDNDQQNPDDTEAEYDFDDEEPENTTEWCWKYGAQLYIKTNFLQTKIKNTDVLAGVRYVRSIDRNNSTDEEKLFDAGVLTLFPEESWQFFLTIRKRF